MSQRRTGRTDELNDHDLKQIETLSGLGLPLDLIAAVIGFTEKTFERRMNESPEAQLAAKTGKAKAVSNVIKTAYEMAIDGKNPALTIFYLKTQARWSEALLPNGKLPETQIKIVIEGDAKNL